MSSARHSTPSHNKIMRFAPLLLLCSMLVGGEATSDPIPPAFIAKLVVASSSLAARDVTPCNDLWDLNAFGERILKGIPMDPKGREEFLSGLGTSFNWGDTILKNTGDTGSYSFLHASRRSGHLRAIFRLINADGSINYHDIEFSSDAVESKIIDVYIYTAAENLSETMNALVANSFAQRDNLDIPGLSREDGLSAYRKLHEQMQQGDFPGLLASFHKLPKDIRNHKATLMLRLQAAQQMSHEEHRLAIHDLVAAFPQNKALDFLLIDIHHGEKEWDLGLSCIDRLDLVVGGDPYLDCLRAGFLTDAGRLTQAREKAEAALLKLPERQQVWWMLFAITLKQKDHKATVDSLNRMRERFSLTFGDLTDMAECKDFVASQEYATWRKAQDITPTPP